MGFQLVCGGAQDLARTFGKGKRRKAGEIRRKGRLLKPGLSGKLLHFAPFTVDDATELPVGM